MSDDTKQERIDKTAQLVVGHVVERTMQRLADKNLPVTKFLNSIAANAYDIAEALEAERERRVGK